MSVKSFQHGISLLEVMLGIAVSAVIAIYIASFIKDRTYQAALDQSMLEIQNWLQAGSSYYIHNKQWPADLQALSGDGNYMREEARCSPWHVVGGDRGCLGRAAYEPVTDSSHYWGIQVVTPSTKIARQLVTILPGSAVINDTIVAAYIPQPSIPRTPNPSLSIKGIFNLQVGVNDATGKLGAPVNAPPCPPDWQWGYDVALNTFYQAHGASIINSIGVIKDVDADGTSKSGYVFVFENMVGIDTHYGNATVITYCKPPDYRMP